MDLCFGRVKTRGMDEFHKLLLCAVDGLYINISMINLIEEYCVHTHHYSFPQQYHPLLPQFQLRESEKALAWVNSSRLCVLAVQHTAHGEERLHLCIALCPWPSISDASTVSQKSFSEGEDASYRQQCRLLVNSASRSCTFWTDVGQSFWEGLERARDKISGRPLFVLQ